jgi:hypothetical protein
MPMNPRLLRPLATGFNPKSISGLAAWYDASDSATLFDADIGGALVAADGDVGRWQDKSGNENHIYQGTANNRPKRRLAAVNSKDAIQFDGSNDLLRVTSTIAIGNGATLIICLRQSAGQCGYHSFAGASSLNAHPFTGSYFESFGSNTRFSWIQALNTTTNQMYSVIAGASLTAYINNAQVFQTNYTKASQNAGQIQCFGAGSFTPAGVASALYAGFLCEMMVFTRSITTSEQTSIYKYLKTKWNLP